MVVFMVMIMFVSWYYGNGNVGIVGVMVMVILV